MALVAVLAVALAFALVVMPAIIVLVCVPLPAVVLVIVVPIGVATTTVEVLVLVLGPLLLPLLTRKGVTKLPAHYLFLVFLSMCRESITSMPRRERWRRRGDMRP